MKRKGYKKNLSEVLKELDEAVYWLNRSYGICQRIGVKEEYSEDQFDAFETLTGRFSRVLDMLLQKVFRSIDKLEFEGEGTLLDVLNRAHKKGLIESIDQIRDIRELRNDIVHEYTPTDLSELFEDTLKYTQTLFEIIDRVKTYSKKFQQVTK